MKAIAKEVSKGEYDLYLFQELWMTKDYERIKARIPEGFHITNYLDFSDPSQKCELQGCLPLCKFLHAYIRAYINNLRRIFESYLFYDILKTSCNILLRL